MRGALTLREHEQLDIGRQLTPQDAAELKEAAGKGLKHKNGGLAASNLVGVVTTRRGLVLEILPKIDLGGEADPGDEKTKQDVPSDAEMLARAWQRRLPESGIRAMPRYPMLDVFVRQFLVNVNALSRAGLARRYISVEENLPYLRGRLLFREQLRANLADGTRFFVAHDVLSVNRPANRLIRSALSRLAPGIRSEENRLLLRRLTAAFADVPEAADPLADWGEAPGRPIHASLRTSNAMGGFVPVQQGTDDVCGTPCQHLPAVPHGEGVRELCDA